MTTIPTERLEALVIGAGQAGLSAGYHLARQRLNFAILEAGARVGDQWRAQYDSLRLYSPAKYDSLPGMPFPLSPGAFPTGRQMADYLEAYAQHHELPVITNARVEDLERADDGYAVTAGGRRYVADQVIVATGPFRVPRVPDFAVDLDPSIRQLHSSEYRNTSQLADGRVLVVGLSHSGADIAHEAAGTHPTTVSGRSHGQLPFSVDSRVGSMAWPLMRVLAMNVLTLDTPIGRRMAPQVRKGGAPLLRHRRRDLLAAGVELIDARTVGVENGRPKLADGRVLDVANVVWCTGFRPDFSWIRLPIFDEARSPRHDRGVVAEAPGLYFLGQIFQSGFTSMLVVGAPRDAAYVVDRALRHRAAGSVEPTAAAAARG